jgi:hypothetical protein
MRRLTLLAGLALAVGATLAAAAQARGTLDPATQHYVDVLQPDMAEIATASEAEHIPCFHSPTGLRGRNCWKLHAALQRATEKTLADLATVEVPQQLVALDWKPKAGLRTYLALIKRYRWHPERTTGHSIETGTLNDTSLEIARRLHTYMPLLG